MKKRYITLLEFLIVFAIIGTVGSVIAWNVRKVVQEQQALNEMELVADLMRTAMDLMMIVNLDSEIQFSNPENHLEVALVPKSGVSPLIAPLIPKKPLVLKSIEEFEFKDGIQDTVLLDQFPLHFFSKGFIMNRGVLTFRSKEVEGSLLLLGYPTALPLIRGKAPEYPDDKPVQDLVYKVTEATRMETSGVE